MQHVRDVKDVRDVRVKKDIAFMITHKYVYTLIKVQI